MKYLALCAIAGAALGIALAPSGLPPHPRTCNPHNVPVEPGEHYARESCGVRDGYDSFGFRHPVAWGRDIVALGDSFTAGYGVEAEHAWPALIGATNLGIGGAAVENIADVLEWTVRPFASHRQRGIFGVPDELDGPLRERLPVGRPRAYVYGINANDVFPRWDSGGITGRPAWREHLMNRGRTRAAMRRMVRWAGPVPVYAMVIEQPLTANRWLVARLEEDAREAGMVVIPSTYLDEHAGEDWRLGHDEAHPNEHAHRVYARAIEEAIP